MPENKHLRRGLFCLYGAAGILFLWLLLRYALPWLLPFIVAFLIARFVEPAVRHMTGRYGIRRGYASALCTIVIFAVLIAATVTAIGRVVIELSALVKDLPTLLKNLTATLSVIGDRIDVYIRSAPPEVQDFLRHSMDGFGEKAAQLPANLSGTILNLLSDVAKLTPKLVLFFFTCALSVFFISCGYEQVTAFLLRQIPKNRRSAMRDFKNDLLSTFGKWVKAELMLSTVTFFVMTIAFLYLRIEFAVVLAFLVAVVDALPVLGSGTVLIPWALVSLIGGNMHTAIALVVIYAINVIIRNLLEPRLIGKQIGLPPLATLVAMYVGFSAVGVLGMLLFPIGLIMLKHLNDKGYIKLWKS